MYNDIINKILEIIDNDSILTEMYPKFPGEGYRAHRIDAKNFYEIKPSNSSKRIAFVDGGNAEIISSANFSVNLIRVSYVVYQNNKKANSKKFEFLAFVHSVSKNNEIYYNVSFFNAKNTIELDEISFSSYDRTLMIGISKADISSVSNAIRRFAELKLAKLVADGKKADIIVLDGNLQSTLTNEDTYLSGLYESCDKNSVVLSALSKTTALFTDNGNLLSAVLANISSIPAWLYYPIADINSHKHKAEVFFVRLNKNSKHIFRFEIFNIQKMKAEETINELACNCIDPIFMGYPYGLIEADKIARVSNQERESLKTMLLLELRNKNIEKYLSSVNAHEILDKISF